VHARVETHLELHRLQRVLKQQNEQLEQAVAARTLELADANRRLTILDTSKNEFLSLISHELRTPLNGLLGAGEIILDSMPRSEENTELEALFKRSRQRILAILDDAMLLTEIDVNGEAFRSGRVSLRAVLGRAIEETAAFAQSRQVILVPPAGSLDIVLADEELLVRALRALLETAVKFSHGGEMVRLECKVLSDPATLIIESQGRTIPSPIIPKFFDVFSISEVSTAGGDLGLGPAVASRILSLFGASVTVANRNPSGIRLTVSLKYGK
jgi:signal transduction histidine kinase